jgi:hypothetical protein
MYRIDELLKLWQLKTNAKSLLAFYHCQASFDDLLAETKAIEAEPKQQEAVKK